MKKKYEGKIPFVKNKKYVPSYVDFWAKQNVLEYKNNFIFNGTLSINGFERGRSAAHLLVNIHCPYTDEDLDIDWLEDYSATLFLKDFIEMIPIVKGIEINDGVLYITGRFAFCKRGSNYGITSIESP